MASSGLCLVANLLLAIFVVFCPQVNCIERGLQEKSTTVSPGIVSMSTEKATLKANVTATTEAPMTTPETPEPTPDDIEWLKFLHLKRNRYISDPEESCHIGGCWDRARLHDPENALFNETGPHAFCDVDGNSLKLSDVIDGMHVKIRAKNVNFPGHEYLYTADGVWGFGYYDELQPNGDSHAHQKQTWIVKIDSDGTFRFESNYWKKGNYLIADIDDPDYPWLYCDDDSSQNWKVELF